MQAACYEYFQTQTDTNLLCVANDKEAKRVRDAIVFAGRNAYILPDLRASFGEDLLPYKEEIYALNTTLRAYYGDPKSKKVLIAPLHTLFSPLPPKSFFQTITLEFGETVALHEFKETLLQWGYCVADVVQVEGEVSFRGDIIDIFPINTQDAFRISFFDDTIESLRVFDPQTQKSQPQELEKLIIPPALFALDIKTSQIAQKSLEEIQTDSFIKDMNSLGLWAVREFCDDYFEVFNIKKLHAFHEDMDEITLFDPQIAQKLHTLKMIPEAKIYKTLEIASVKNFLDFHKNKKITLLAKNEILLRQQGLDVHMPFVQSELIVNLISEKQIILSLNKEQKRKKRKRSNMILDELNIGDYVVHENYGIGIFQGLQNTTVLGATRDFVVIAYLGEDRLLLPVENLHMIDRYIGEGGHLAVVDKLGKGSFQKLKAKTREKLFEIAAQIVKTAAAREMIRANVLHVKPQIAAFQQDAGFTYTDDQIKCIEEIFTDLGSGQMMDRLLSGDVGFGKTEVAMNAIFLSALNGYQSIMMAPTTLLCTQHYKSLYTRMKPYGIRVEKLDRFTSAKQKSTILHDLREGKLLVCVGTHSLLSVELGNPALIVVDEEHKFGVKQKEKLKQMRENVHILSMSATPIPRSLNMALSSIKQYSQILTPPSDRQDLRTFVKDYDEKLLKEVIMRELRRGGQVFFVHNRIASIEIKKAQLQRLLPQIKILSLHSKINAQVTEEEMMKFENKEYDILLSTSIIESGIHIPNVNTIIVDGSENFGMADLHQIRGRVGRGKRQGYCYFLVKDKENLSVASRKRLIALESNSYLGSGAVLAYHDLEIRGGGNLIGEAQSGHIKNIGYSLYLKMLEDAIATLLNQTPIKKKEVDIKLSISAYLNADLIHEDRVRLELYRRLSHCVSVAEVLEIEEEMVDRFGKLDVQTKQFLDLITIKILASINDVVFISNYGQNITIKEQNETKTLIKARSKDDDDIIIAVLEYLRKRKI
ncbi:MAG: transcription-repair coupling factor [Sulfurospirillum sp.]|nr:transcription-repair coupling factor [Sulfurospirillum sp.]